MYISQKLVLPINFSLCPARPTCERCNSTADDFRRQPDGAERRTDSSKPPEDDLRRVWSQLLRKQSQAALEKSWLGADWYKILSAYKRAKQGKTPGVLSAVRGRQ